MFGDMFGTHGDLPLSNDASGRLLPWLVTVMVFLAALALVSAMTMHKIASRWDQGLTGQITVQIPPASAEADGSESPTSPDMVYRVLELIRSTPGVREVRLLGSGEIAELLEPWLGPEGTVADLPLPRLLAVSMESSDQEALSRLSERLAAAAPGVTVEDHQRWLANLLDLAYSIELIALLIVVLVCFSAILMVVAVTRMGLAVHHQIIELLHLVGAHDSYVAGQFQRHALFLGLRGGLQGLAIAVPTTLLVGYLVGRTEAVLLPEMKLSAYEWFVLALLPAAAAGITMLTARITVLRRLSRLP